MTTTSNTDVRGEMGSGPFKGRGRIEDVVHELRRQVDARVDFVVDTRELAVEVGESGNGRAVPLLVPATDSARDFVPSTGYRVLDPALMQVGGRAISGGVPHKFLRRAWDENPVRTAQFLTGLMHDDPKRRLVRVLDDEVRAFLGSTYRCIDNLDIARKALNAAIEHDAVPIEATLTDRKMRLRFVSRKIGEALQREGRDSGKSWYAGGLGSQDALRKVAAQSWGKLPDDGDGDGDTVHPALGFSNSETGHGGCDVDGGILLGACFNLAWVVQLVHEVHVGGKLEEGLFTEETFKKHADLVYAKVDDVVGAYFSAEHFAQIAAGMKDAQTAVIKAPSVACRVAIKTGDALNEGDLDNLVSYFAQQPGGFNEYNLGQAVSRLAQDVEPDRAADLEWFAGKVCSGAIHAEVARAEREHAEAAAALVS